jgi:hypothetical protein
MSSLETGPEATAWFYRVVRTPAGIVDGWGPTYTAPPEVLSNVLAVCASPSEGGAHSLALRLDGTLVAWGNNRYGQTNVPAGLPNVAAMAAGARHSVVALRDGRVVAWGDNTLGQTNVPADLSNVVDVKAACGTAWRSKRTARWRPGATCLTARTPCRRR